MAKAAKKKVVSILTGTELVEFDRLRVNIKEDKKEYEKLRKKILFTALHDKKTTLRRGSAVAIIDEEERTNVDWQAIVEKLKGPDYVAKMVRITPKMKIQKIRISINDS